MKNLLLIFILVIVACSVSGQSVVDNIMKARALSQIGLIDDALKIISDATSSVNDYRYYVERADINYAIGNYSDAIRDYEEANKLLPFSGEYGLARVYAMKGDAITALYHLEQNMVSSLKKSEKEILLDPAFSIIEGRGEWRTFWRKEWYTTAEKGSSEIAYLVSAGKTDQAHELLNELKISYPDNDDVIFSEALLDFALKKYPEVLKITNSLLLTDPQKEKYLKLLVNTQIAVSNVAGASESYTRMIEAGIIDPKLFLLRAECYRQTGEYNKAILDIEKYMDLYPDDKEALSLAGKIETLNGDNLKALAFFSKNVKLHPNDPYCYIDRANSYLASKSWEWAIQDYSMSLDLNPENSDAWLNKGVALLNSGKIPDACHDLLKSMSLGNKRAANLVGKNCIK